MAGVFKREGKIELTVANIIILTTFSLVLLQGIGLIINSLFGTKIYFGPVFLLLSVVAAATLGFVLVKKLLEDSYIQKEDMFAVMVVAILAILVLLFLRDLVPEVFGDGMQSLIEMMG